MVDVLLIDDILENAALFATVLQMEGFTVELKSDGEEAIAYLEKQIKNKNGLPRIIVTDVSMPKMDGFELCFIIKNTPEYWDIPVILFTAVWPELTKKLALTVTPDDYLIKPIESKDLVKKVKDHIKKP